LSHCHGAGGGCLHVPAVQPRQVQVGQERHSPQGGQALSHKEIDPVSGTETTGHDWNGIKELDTPVPRAILLFIIVTHVWAVIYWVLMPAWPVAFTYTKGLLGIDQKQTVEARLQADQLARSAWLDQVRSLSYDEIAADEALMSRVVETGHQLFGDNCAVCHGRDAQGNAGYPN